MKQPCIISLKPPNLYCYLPICIPTIIFVLCADIFSCVSSSVTLSSFGLVCNIHIEVCMWPTWSSLSRKKNSYPHFANYKKYYYLLIMYSKVHPPRELRPRTEYSKVFCYRFSNFSYLLSNELSKNKYLFFSSQTLNR